MLKSIILKFINFTLLKKNSIIINYNNSNQKKVMSFIKNIKSENDMALSFNEAYQLYMTVKNSHKVSGVIAEVGTYKGDRKSVV